MTIIATYASTLALWWAQAAVQPIPTPAPPQIAFPGQYAAMPTEWKYPAWPKSCARFKDPEKSACLEFVVFDFGQLKRFAAANAALAAPAKGESRVVFFGDSITDNWSKAGYGGFFPGKPYINRGIGGHSTPQMLIRFRRDVLASHPRAVVILAGTNDIGGNVGIMPLDLVQDNLATMAELAKVHGIKVIFASLLPVRDGKMDKEGKPSMRTIDRPTHTLRAMNNRLSAYAETNGHVYLDYWSAVADDKGLLKSELTDDGLHPNAAGYAVMAPLAEAAIARALGLQKTSAPVR